ncbi:MAG: amidohydrolase family protein [Bacteroidota bacterium]|nr:amidohydrolase family protein [Bacteroidota bacterium]
MRQIAASMAFDGYRWIHKPLLKLDDKGVIIDVGRFDPVKSEPTRTEYYHGILTPGFLNAHVHLELSFKDAVFTQKSGMSDFIAHVRGCRENLTPPDTDRILSMIRKIQHSGTVALCDVMNAGSSLNLLEQSTLKHINFFEYYMLNDKKLQQQYKNLKSLIKQHPNAPLFPALHALYTLTGKNFSMVKKLLSGSHTISTLHFKETHQEIQLYRQKGQLYNLYRQLDNNYQPQVYPEHLIEDIFGVFKHTGKILFVHNTFVDNQDVNAIEHLMKKTNKEVAFVLCPRSNENISAAEPPYNTLRKSGVPVMLGTDSLLSAPSLSIFDELMFVHHGIHDIPLGEMLQWITINPARFLGLEESMGSLRPGKKPGINLIHGKGVSAEQWPENAELKVLM